MITKKLLEQWRQDYLKYLDPERVKPESDLNWYIAQRAAAHGAAQSEPFAPDWVNYRQGVKDGAEQMRDRCAEVVDANANTCVQDSLLWIALNSNAAAIRSLK